MDSISPSKINVQFRDGANINQPLRNRVYTVTHSDDTGEMYVTIGRGPAVDLFNETRDEVIIEITNENGSSIFLGQVIIDMMGQDFDSEMRYEIFLREMHKVLQSIRYADWRLFVQYPNLDQIPILIWFQSSLDKFNRLYDFGTMSDFQIVPDKRRYYL